MSDVRLPNYYRQQQDDAATRGRDFSRGLGDIRGEIARLMGLFSRRWRRQPQAVTPNTVRPMLRFEETTYVHTAEGSDPGVGEDLTLYLPTGTPSDEGRWVAFVKQDSGGVITVQASPGAFINKRYERVSGFTELGLHTFLWDGTGWNYAEPVSRAQQHELLSGTVGLWQFDVGTLLTDTSGNGFTLTVETGTERYGRIDAHMHGFYFDGSTSLIHNVSEATLRITGDMTFMCLWAMHTAVADAPIVYHGGAVASDLEVNNIMYRVGHDTPYPNWVFQSESGAGTDAFHGVPSLLSLPGRTVHVGFTRSSGVVQLYENGRALGAASSPLTTPTGGATGRFRLGGNNATRVNGMMASAIVLNRALTTQEVRDQYNHCLGRVYGRTGI